MADTPSKTAARFPGRVDVPLETMRVVSAEGTFHRHSAFDAVDAVIMMVDDEALNTDMSQAFLEDAGYRNFVSTNDATDAIRLMRQERPHVLLLDLSMPGRSGMEILREISEDEQLRLTPVIVLTSNTDPSSRLRALSLGATDFLQKPVDPSELALRLRNTLAARAHRDYLAQHDALTGLRNRMRCNADVQAAVADATERHHGCAVMHLGVDRLAQVNDALGRAAGDALLYRMARRLRQCVESADLGHAPEFQPTIYRLDGDEFAVLVPYLDEIEDAAGLITNLMDAAAVRMRAGDREIFVTASMGVAMYPMDAPDGDRLIGNAAVAMRQAKQAGRNTYEFFTPRFSERAVHTLRIGSDLRRALARDELSLLYSPKLDVRTGRVMGAETVLRWNHPSGSVVEGDTVLRMASTSEMSMVLGEWAMEHVVAQTKAWSEAGVRNVPLAVNLSLRNFPVGPLSEMIDLALRGGAKGEWLCVELGDVSAVEDLQPLVRFTARMREQGVRVALDGFGTSQAALSLLAEGLMLSEIKLASSFLAGFDERGKGPGAPIVQATLSLARMLRLTPVATGVDSMFQLAFLKNCDPDQCWYQGDLFGPLLTAGDFAGKYLQGRTDLVE